MLSNNKLINYRINITNYQIDTLFILKPAASMLNMLKSIFKANVEQRLVEHTAQIVDPYLKTIGRMKSVSDGHNSKRWMHCGFYL